MIPVSCFLEVVLDKVQYSRDTKLSILLVLLGVGVCTVTDVSVNMKGFVAAVVAVWSTALQQYVSNCIINLKLVLLHKITTLFSGYLEITIEVMIGFLTELVFTTLSHGEINLTDNWDCFGSFLDQGVFF